MIEKKFKTKIAHHSDQQSSSSSSNNNPISHVIFSFSNHQFSHIYDNNRFFLVYFNIIIYSNNHNVFASFFQSYTQLTSELRIYLDKSWASFLILFQKNLSNLILFSLFSLSQILNTQIFFFF